MGQPAFTVIIPCFNEEQAIATTLEGLQRGLAGMGEYEILAVDDGSTDATAARLAAAAEGGVPLRLLRHTRNKGYGASLKTGIRHARSDLIVITDADGTYPNDRIPELLQAAREADMVVGARIAEDVVYPLIRKIPKLFLAAYASWLVGEKIPDINSGLRVFRRSLALDYLKILPDGFSFTTTITVALMSNNYAVRFIPIGYRPRIGKSKIRPIRDTLKFFQLILRTGTYFAPLRVFMPIVGLVGAGFAASLCYDLFWLDDITDKTLLLLLFTMNTGMFALLADMVDKRSG